MIVDLDLMNLTASSYSLFCAIILTDILCYNLRCLTNVDCCVCFCCFVLTQTTLKTAFTYFHPSFHTILDTFGQSKSYFNKYVCKFFIFKISIVQIILICISSCGFVHKKVATTKICILPVMKFFLTIYQQL